MRLRWSDDAKASLRSIREQYNQLSAGAGNRVAKRVFAGTRRLRRFPTLGRVVPEYESPLVRELIQGDFRVWYVVASDEIRIIAVSHGARDTR